MRKQLALAVASLFTVIAPAAHAAHDRYGNYYEPRDYRSSDYRDDTARVIESRPVYSRGRYGDRLEGYDVRYVYRGQEYTTRMKSDPGRRLVIGRDLPADAPATSVANSYECRTVDPINRPGWCDSDGQGG